MTQHTHPLDELLPIIGAALESWKAKNTPQQLTQSIHARLDKQANDIVLKLLGFNSEYSSYRLDHCNGRSGNSAAGDYLLEQQRAAVRSWLESVGMPVLSEEQRQALAADMQKHYLSRLTQELKTCVGQRAMQDAQVLAERVCKPLQVESYAQLMQLITPEN